MKQKLFTVQFFSNGLLPALKVCCVLLSMAELVCAQESAPAYSPAGISQEAAKLATEVHDKGWIAYSAPSEKGNWDIFIMRPDGSDRKNITRTEDYNEAGPRFSPDGTRLLYYQMPKGQILDNNRYGLFDLVISRADGSQPVVYGSGFPWASWSPDGTQISCLAKDGIHIYDLASRKEVRKLDRKGMVEQLRWSPDGKWLVGTANGLGTSWSIGRINAFSGELNLVSDNNCFNCTSSWFPDSMHIIYSKGLPMTEGWAQLWCANGDGTQRHMLYGEIGRHIYGGRVSPDGNYVLFTRSREDLGRVNNSFTSMALMRLKDAPMVGGESAILHKQYPQAKSGPVLDLSWGWEPSWTATDIEGGH